jgi:transposase
MANRDRVVTGGVDTHKDVHVAAVVDAQGRILETAEFATSVAGCRRLLAWMQSFGEVDRVGVEGTGAYGAGLSRYLRGVGVTIVEVNRPNRQMRRRRGKSDAVDAEAAARAALNGEAAVIPKTKDSLIESIRVLRVAFTSARNSRTRVANQVRDLIVTAPDQIRRALDPLTTAERVERCARFRPGDPADPAEATRLALRTLSRRYEALTEEMGELTRTLDDLTTQANPALRSTRGVGTDVAAILLVAAGDNPERLTSEAAFAALCGVAPVQASSGKTHRHRLNRSGNRQANHALWRIAMVRLTCDPRTKAYVERRTAEGKSRREIMRCLKRYIAREVFALLTNPQVVPNGQDLREARTRCALSLRVVAEALGTSISTISRLELGRTHDAQFAIRYGDWLESVAPAA